MGLHTMYTRVDLIGTGSRPPAPQPDSADASAAARRPNMYTPRHRSAKSFRPILGAMLTVLVVSQAHSQPASAAGSAPAGPDTRRDDVVQLSEFQVNESRDRGYAATYTLGGSRISTEISKAPISVVVFNEDFRFDTASLDIQEIARFTAGVTGAANIGSGQLSLRGQNLSATTFRDGIPRNSNAGEAPDYMDMALVERVEVIKGPAGTLYGAHNSGGMINYVSKRPLDKARTTLFALTQPNRHLMRFEVDDTRPLGGGWSYRAILAYQKGTTLIGTRNDVRSGEVSLAKSTHWANFLLRVSRTERDWLNSGSWFADVANNVSTFLNYKLPIGEPDGVRNHNANSVDFESAFKASVLGLTVKNRLIARYSNSMMDTYNYSAANANIRFFNAAGALIGNSATNRLDDPRLATIVVTRGANLRQFDQEVWSVDYDAVVDFTTGPANHKLLAYGEIAGTKRDAGVYSATYAPINLMAPVYYFPNTAAQRGPWIVASDNHFETFADAAAVQDNISFLQDKLILVAGARYDYAINDTFNKLTKRYTRSDDARDGVTHKWAAVYRLHPYVNFYYNYSETFQPTSTNIGGVTLPNVESNNNEAGVKVALPNGLFSATASYFKVITDNVVIAVPVVVPATGAVTTVSLPEGRRTVEGWDVDFTANPLRNLTLLGGFGTLRSRTETRLRARGVPDGFNYRVFARQTVPLAQHQSLLLGVGFEHTSPRALDAADTFLLPKMDLLDAMVGWRRGGLTLQVNVGNVANKIVPRAGTTRADITPTDPRSVRLSARWTF